MIEDLSEKLDQAIAEHVKFMRTLGDGFATDARRMEDIIGLIGSDDETAISKLRELAIEYAKAAKYLADVTSEADQ